VLWPKQTTTQKNKEHSWCLTWWQTGRLISHSGSPCPGLITLRGKELTGDALPLMAGLPSLLEPSTLKRSSPVVTGWMCPPKKIMWKS
jgi:hypothetical protein